MDTTEEAPAPAAPPLDSNATCDVCVVGAGIAGLSVAYHLSKLGRSVLVLDDGPIGGGETGRTTAHLSNAIDDRYYEIEHLHGEEGARLTAESHTSAIDRIESIVTEENIECDFTRLDGFLFQPDGEDAKRFDDELQAARRAGLLDVARVDRAPISSFDTGPCLVFPRQGQFHALKYLHGLARAAVRNQSRICTGTHVVEVEGGSDALVKTSGGQVVSASAIVVATNTPMNDRFSMHTKQSAYRTYAIAVKFPAGSDIPRVLLWDGFWDGDDPYHYIRTHGDLLIVGGEDHKTGQVEGDPAERYARLENWTRRRFPMLGDVAFRWSGQVMEPVDGLAFIGRNPADKENVYIVTGDSGLGMTHGTIAGMLITDLILERENPWAKLYDPSRRTLKAGTQFAKENLNVAAQYMDWVTGSEVSDLEKIAPGKGAVVRRGMKKIAVYRAPDGTLHERSAVCPHLGCVVRWNDGEKSWDCPCHGSRFDALGQVLNGPAVSGLTGTD